MVIAHIRALGLVWAIVLEMTLKSLRDKGDIVNYLIDIFVNRSQGHFKYRNTSSSVAEYFEYNNGGN
jgi:hypothetical protein